MENQQQDEKEKVDKKKRNRRCTKEDHTPRAYKCGCGKGYYSYPALYTHIKLKHEGNPQTGTAIPNDKHYGNRGRPKEKNKIEREEEQHQVFIDEDKKDDQKQTEVLINKE